MENEMNVSLNPHFERFVEEVVAGGRFKSSSEVIREGLRLLEERELRLMAVRRQLDTPTPTAAPVVPVRGPGLWLLHDERAAG
jgi:putative addiction module CopG family antidote